MPSIDTVSVTEWLSQSLSLWNFLWNIFLTKLSIKEQAIIAWFTSYKRCVSIWRQTMVSDHRIGSIFFHGSVCVSLRGWHRATCPTCTCRFMKARAKTCSKQLEELWSNFKIKLQWVPNSESAQFFWCDSVCVSSTCLTTCHMPCARLWVVFGHKGVAYLLTVTGPNFIL